MWLSGVNLMKTYRVIGSALVSNDRSSSPMRNVFLATAAFAAIAAATPSAHADMVGATAGAEVGLVVAGPVGAVAGGVVGAVYGKPFWGPSVSRGHCSTDNSFHRHCDKHWSSR